MISRFAANGVRAIDDRIDVAQVAGIAVFGCRQQVPDGTARGRSRADRAHTASGACSIAGPRGSPSRPNSSSTVCASSRHPAARTPRRIRPETGRRSARRRASAAPSESSARTSRRSRRSSPDAIDSAPRGSRARLPPAARRPLPARDSRGTTRSACRCVDVVGRVPALAAARILVERPGGGACSCQLRRRLPARSAARLMPGRNSIDRSWKVTEPASPRSHRPPT